MKFNMAALLLLILLIAALSRVADQPPSPESTPVSTPQKAPSRWHVDGFPVLATLAELEPRMRKFGYAGQLKTATANGVTVRLWNRRPHLGYVVFTALHEAPDREIATVVCGEHLFCGDKRIFGSGDGLQSLPNLATHVEKFHFFAGRKDDVGGVVPAGQLSDSRYRVEVTALCRPGGVWTCQLRGEPLANH
jgi:hypothetical protein